MHEIGHWYKTSDSKAGQTHLPNCTYGNDRNELETMAMCEECTQIILSNRTVHGHVFREVTQ